MFWETSGDSSSTGRIESTDQGYILDLVKNLTSRVFLLCIIYLARGNLKFCDNFPWNVWDTRSMSRAIFCLEQMWPFTALLLLWFLPLVVFSRTSPTSFNLSSQRKTLAIYRYFITVLSADRFVVTLKVQVMNFCDSFIGLCGTLIFYGL